MHSRAETTTRLFPDYATESKVNIGCMWFVTYMNFDLVYVVSTINNIKEYHLPRNYTYTAKFFLNSTYIQTNIIPFLKLIIRTNQIRCYKISAKSARLVVKGIVTL